MPALVLPLKVTAGYMLNLVLVYGPTTFLIFITEDNGTILPKVFLTYILLISEILAL